MPNETGVIPQSEGAADQDTEILDTDQNEGDSGAEDSKHEESVPYEKFKKTNEDLKMTKAQYEKLQQDFDSVKDFLDFIEDLRAEGIKNSDDVRAFIQKNNAGTIAAQLKAAEQNARQKYWSDIEQGIDQEVATREYQLSVKEAKLQHDSALLAQREAEIKRTSSGSLGQRIKSLMDKYPLADEETLRDLASVPGTDLEAKAKRLHEKETKRQVEYSTKKSQQSGTKDAITKSGSQSAPAAGSAPPDPLKYPKEAKAWLDKVTKKLSAG